MQTKGGMNAKLHAVTPAHGLQANHCPAVDTSGRPIRVFITAGQVREYTVTMTFVRSPPAADWLLGAVAMMLIGSAKPCQTGVQNPASQIASPAIWSSDTISVATEAATVSRARLAGPKTGDVSQHAMIDAQRSSCQPSLSPQQPYAGYES